MGMLPPIAHSMVLLGPRLGYRGSDTGLFVLLQLLFFWSHILQLVSFKQKTVVNTLRSTYIKVIDHLGINYSHQFSMIE